MKKIILFLLGLSALFVQTANAETVFSGEHAVRSWDAQQLPVGDYPVLSKASAGDVIAVTISESGGNGRVTLQDNSWSGFADAYNCADGRHYFVLSETDAATVAANGLIVTGENYTLTCVELLYKQTLWEGTVDDNSGWGQSDAIDNSIFAGLTAGDVLGIGVTAINDGATYHQTAIRVDYTTNIIEGSTSEAKTLLYELTADQVTKLQTKTINVIAQYLCVSALYTWTDEQPGEEDGDVTELWNGSTALGDWGNFESLRYDGKGELAHVKVGDAIRVTFTNAAEGWQVYVCDASSYSEFSGGYFSGEAQDEAQSVVFTVTSATILEAICDRGIVVKGKLVTLTKIELITYDTSYDAVAVSIGTEGIATWSSSKKLDFSQSGITAYYASRVSTGVVYLTSATTTWGYQGYIIRGAAGTYDVPVTDDAEYPETNYLKATSDYAADIAASEEGTWHYIFAKKNDNSEYGFYKLTTSHTLAAHKAYLETSTDIAPATQHARIAFVFEEDATGITHLNHSAHQGRDIFDLQGRRVSGKPSKGLYIVNGKKTVLN